MFLTRSLNYGGAERQLVVLATGLQRRGHLVSVAVFYPDGPLQDELDSAGVPVHCLNKYHRWDMFGFLFKLYKLVKREGPDILHGYLVVPNLLTLVMKLFGCPARMVWGVRASNMDLSCYDWTARATFKLSCLFSRYADLIIVNSSSGKDFHLLQGYPDSGMVVVPNGIDTDRFKPDSHARIKIRKEWGLGEGDLLIGMVARLDPMKNYEAFLQAASILAKEKENIHFVCIGDGPLAYKEELRNIGSPLEMQGKLKWVGVRENMPEVFNAMDICTNCSHTEGFPNVVGEAMSCGVLCLVTDVGDSAEIVRQHGVIVPPGRVDLIVAGWKKLLGTVDYCESKSIRERIVRNYSIETLIENTEKALLGSTA